MCCLSSFAYLDFLSSVTSPLHSYQAFVVGRYGFTMSSTQRRSWNVSPSFLMQVVGQRSQSTTGDRTGPTKLDAGALVTLSWWHCVCKDHMSLLCPGPPPWSASLAIKRSELLHGDALKQGLIMSSRFPRDGIPRLQLSVTNQWSRCPEKLLTLQPATSWGWQCSAFPLCLGLLGLSWEADVHGDE